MLYEIVTRVRDDLPTLDAIMATGDPELGKLAEQAREGNILHFKEAYMLPLLESLEPAGRESPVFHRDHFGRLYDIDEELLCMAFAMSGSPFKQTHTLSNALSPAESRRLSGRPPGPPSLGWSRRRTLGVAG